MATKKITDLVKLTDLDATDSFVVNDSSAGADKRVEFSDLQSEVLNGAAIGTGTAITELQVDNLNLNGNTLSSTDTNGNVLIQPNGTGDVVINESGADVDFRVEGDTEQNLLFVDASADAVGIGTSSPGGSGLHIRKDTSATTNELLRLSNSAGSTTDGVKLVMEVANTSGNGGEIGVVRDGGSLNPYMYFSTSAGVGSSPTERLRIDSSGNVGIGTASPNATLAFGGSSDVAFNTSLGGTGTYAEIKAYNSLAPSNPATNIRFIRDVASVGNDGAICFDTVNAERMRIDSSGNVGIGVTPSAWANHKAIDVGVAGCISSYNYTDQLRVDIVANGYATAAGSYYYKNNGFAGAYYINNGIHSWYTAGSGTAGGAISFTEKARIDSDGLKFNGDTAAANALDDYEEGTFTPTIIGSTSAGTASYTFQVGSYTKIGRMVRFEIFIAWSGGTGTGNIKIAGLPFTSSSSGAPSASIGYFHNIALAAAGNVPLASAESNATNVEFFQIPSGGGANAAISYDAAGEIQVSGLYSV